MRMQPKLSLLVHKLQNGSISNLHLQNEEDHEIKLVLIENCEIRNPINEIEEEESNRTSTPSEEAAEVDAEAEAEEEGEKENSESRERKRKRAKAKNPRAMRKSNAMNQFCCQIGNSDSERVLDSR